MVCILAVVMSNVVPQYSAPGSYGYYTQDTKMMASWGMDYLKCDSCGGSQDHNEAFKEYGEIRDA